LAVRRDHCPQYLNAVIVERVGAGDIKLEYAQPGKSQPNTSATRFHRTENTRGQPPVSPDGAWSRTARRHEMDMSYGNERPDMALWATIPTPRLAMTVQRSYFRQSPDGARVPNLHTLRR